MKSPSNLRNRLVLVTVIFMAVAPTLGLVFNTDETEDIVWAGLSVGALALTLGWFSWGDYFIREIKKLSATTKRLAAGDLSARAGLESKTAEFAALGRNINTMAESLEKQQKERDQVERTLLNRTHQQTVVAALGQFAMICTDFKELLGQAANFIGQTLEIEYAGIWEMNPDGQALTLRAGTGWKAGMVGTATLETGGQSLVNHMFAIVEPLIVGNLQAEKKFKPPAVLLDHGVVSFAAKSIAGDKWPYGIITVGATKDREITEDEIHFLIAVSAVLAMAVNRRQIEEQLTRLAAFAQLNPNPILEFDAEGNLVYFNDAALAMARQLGVEHPRAYLPTDLKNVVRESLTSNAGRQQLETRAQGRILAWTIFPIVANQAVHCYITDITERTNLEAQLRQSQKMESVGQLAAGVAHDFNNILTIVQGHSGVILSRQGGDPALIDSAQAIYFAAERAATLTRQLLMFSRKNLAQPRLLDLREVVTNLTKMLRRLLGESVELQFKPADNLPTMRGDSGMMEQVIVNLAVNARDAMPKGGRLTIELSTVDFDRRRLEIHPQARLGRFIRLAVTDTGTGIPPEVQNRIFEPFFTTKEVGKGTGLGLATVYGIVKQHGGWIELASQVGKGTTFEVFLPASTEKIDTELLALNAGITTRIRGGNETILLVEDEAVIRDLAHLILREQGYRVLEAANGVEAVAIWRKERDSIDLLLTDMVLPEGMNGQELADKLRREKPGLKVICASGYSMDEIEQEGMGFLQKPYTRVTLTKTVRECLDKRAAERQCD